MGGRGGRRWWVVLLGRGALETVVVAVALSVVVGLPSAALAFLFSEAPEGGKTVASEVRYGLWLAGRSVTTGLHTAAQGAFLVLVGSLLVWFPALARGRGSSGRGARRSLRAVVAVFGAAVVFLEWNRLAIAFGDPLSFPLLLLVPMTVVAAVAWWRAGAVLRDVARAAEAPDEPAAASHAPA